ncbi:hypothetical protein I3760_03G275000 [Carya illinoinensis]|nr:hypothetical protein I3760_03G275000 [Carya illinoinensis]
MREGNRALAGDVLRKGNDGSDMKPKIISWNVRGLNEQAKWLQVRNLLRQWQGDIICLQETKLELITRPIV